MKIKIMKAKAVEYVKKNIDVLKNHYLNRENPEVWLKEALHENPFVDTELFADVSDFSLELNDSNGTNKDVPNIKLIYKNFIELNDSFASDERFWAGIAHTYFYNFVLDRYPLSESKDVSGDIINHFFFKQGRPRCYMVNTLARLWWLGRMLYSEENEFKLLDYIAHDINGYSFTLFGSNWSNNREILNAFFNGIFEFEEKNSTTVKRLLFNDAMQYVQCLTGKLIVDACDEDYIQSKVYDYLVERSHTIEMQAEIDKQMNIKRTGTPRLDKIIIALNEIGGIGDMKNIYSAFYQIDKSLSESDKNYIKDNLKAYSPDATSQGCKGNIFYKTKIGDAYYWRLANDYLTISNTESRRNFVQKNILKLDGFDKQIFNWISASKKDRFSLDEISAFKPFLPDLDNIDSAIQQSIKNLREGAILEYQGEGVFKKSFRL